MDVEFSYANGMLDIYPIQQGIRLEHPPGCPCRFLTPTDIASLPSSLKTQGVSVGVAVILQSSDCNVLLTRRARHMRTFPSVWVPPGGHVETGELLHQACLRKLREETGLNFSQDKLLISSLGLWETVYPPLLSMGLPTSHHIVVYLLAKAQEDCRTLQQQISFCEQEVDAVTWLDQNIVADIAASDDYGQSRKVPQRYFSALVKEKEGLQTKKLPLSILMAVLPPTAMEDMERLSTGTKFAFRQWLKVLYSPPVGSLGS